MIFDNTTKLRSVYKAITNANIVTPDGILYDGTLVIENNRIADILNSISGLPDGTEVIDAKGSYVGPGFVDIHVHGSGSIETWDASAAVVDHFLRHGTTTLLATPAYSQNFNDLISAINSTKKAMQKSRVIKGIYMEGPYTNPNYGAKKDKNPWRHGIMQQEYRAIVDACGTDVKVWTVAPELEGVEDFLAYAKMVNPDVVFAVGHSEATHAQISALGRYRPTLLTHAMDATGRISTVSGTRGYGPDEYCFSKSDMYAELISDSCGIHVNPALQRMLLQIKGVDKVVLITDSTVVESPSPECFSHITDLNFDHNGKLCGSQLTMDRACKNIMSHTNCGIAQAFIMASLNPAKIIGLDEQIGSIEKGKLADLVFVDDKFNVMGVMSEGRFL